MLEDIYHDTRDYRALNGYLGNRRGEGGPEAAHAFTQPASSRRSWRPHRMPGRLACAGRCRPAPAAAWPARAAAAAGRSRSSSWSSAGAVARKARSTSRRAACRDRGPQPLATGWPLPHAARLLRAPPCRVRVAAGFPCYGCSLPGAPKKHRKQVITGGECASRRGTAYF